METLNNSRRAFCCRINQWVVSNYEHKTVLFSVSEYLFRAYLTLRIKDAAYFFKSHNAPQKKIMRCGCLNS